MPITERTTFASLTILEDGQILVRRARIILDADGVTEINRVFHRVVLEPGQKVSTYPARIRKLCAFVWTPTVVTAYATRKAAQARQRP